MSKHFNQFGSLVAAAILAGAMVPQAVAKDHHHSSNSQRSSNQSRFNSSGNSGSKQFARQLPSKTQQVYKLHQGPATKYTPVSQGNKTTKGPVVRWPSNTKFPTTQATPIRPTKGPIVVDPVRPPKGPIKPPIVIDPVRPPKGPIKPPVGPINPKPPVDTTPMPPKDPGQPKPPHKPPHDGNHGHHGHHGHKFPWPIFLGSYGNGGYYRPNYPVQRYPVQTYPVQSYPVQQATYAEAAPAAPQTAAVDLVLEDLQFVEPATLLVGPAYRVKFRNQSLEAVGKFRVALLAGMNGQVSEDAPKAIVEVASLAAGEAGEVTVRLPKTALQMVAGGGEASAFTHLFVAVDLDNAIAEQDKENNVAVVERTQLETAAR